MRKIPNPETPPQRPQNATESKISQVREPNPCAVQTLYALLAPKNLLTVKPAPNTTAARLPPTTAARNATFNICMRFLLWHLSTNPSVSLVRGNFLPSGTGTSRNSHSGPQPSPILYSRRFSAGTSERISS